VGPGVRPHLTGPQTVTLTPDAIIAVLFAVFSLVAFLLMLQESLALGRGQDPANNEVRSIVRRFPRVTYAFAVLIGMVLGHLLWP
jgi:hypothetical protein